MVDSAQPPASPPSGNACKSTAVEEDRDGDHHEPAWAASSLARAMVLLDACHDEQCPVLPRPRK